MSCSILIPKYVITALFTYLIPCSYQPIVRSIRQNIRTEVLTYGPNEMRFVQKTKVRIFPVWNEQLVNKSFNYCIATMVTEFEIHTAFGRSIRLWTDLGLTNQIASFSLATQ